jgi:PTH2 family peptidyl-tRNA hydrolase
MDSAKTVQYYVAERGRLADGALAVLAARGALLGHARWRTRPAYARWHDHVMTKVVLGATDAELATIRAAAAEVLALTQAGQEAIADEPAALLVLPPQPKSSAAALLGHLRLAAGTHGHAPEPAAGPLLLLVAAGDLGMHGGKLAAQCAHAALLAQVAYSQRLAWSVWVAASRPIALRRADSAALAELAERYSGGAVHDAGHTQVPAGSLTVVAVPPGAAATDHLRADLAPW